MKTFDFIPFEYEVIHTNNGSHLLHIPTLEQNYYKNEIINYLKNIIKNKTFYDLNASKKIFEFMNNFIDFNRNNSKYPDENNINPFKATIGVFSKNKHSIFDSLLPLGLVLSTRYSNNKKLLTIPKLYKIDDYEYDKIFNEIYSKYRKQLKSFKTNACTNCYLENLMLVSLIEKVLKNGLYLFLVRLLIKTIKTNTFITKEEREEAVNIENGNFLGTLEVKVLVLLSIAKKYNLFPKYDKAFDLILNGYYIDDKGTNRKNTLSTLLDNKIMKKIFDEEFFVFLKYIFKDLNIRNDYSHMNNVWYKANNIMITSILLYLIHIIMAYFINTEGNEEL